MSHFSTSKTIFFLFLLTFTASSTNAQSVSLNGQIIEISGTSRSDSVKVTRSYGYSRSSKYDDQIVVYPDTRLRTTPKKLPLYRKIGRRYYLQVAGIQFLGGSGDDTFVNNTNLPTSARGGNGDDTLVGGSGKDVLYGDRGEDTLRGMAGDDDLYGGDDSDLIDGGAGKDVMLGRDAWIEGQSSGFCEPQSSDPGHYDEFIDDFDLSTPVINGTKYTDVDQARSHSCTILSSLASAANMGVDLGDRIFQDPNDPTRFTVLLFDTDGKSMLPVDVTFDGSWTSNDAPPTRERGSNGRPTGAMNGEFWALLYQRAYLTAYVDNWQNPDPATWTRPGGTPGAWGRRGHALRAIVGGVNIGSWDWTSDANAAPLPEELRVALDQGIVMTTRVSGHIVALLDVFERFQGKWQILIYNQRALDNYGSRGAIADGQSDGVMLFEWIDYLASFNVVTPFDPEGL